MATASVASVAKVEFAVGEAVVPATTLGEDAGDAVSPPDKAALSVVVPK
jgi:hypothetical protein